MNMVTDVEQYIINVSCDMNATPALYTSTRRNLRSIQLNTISYTFCIKKNSTTARMTWLNARTGHFSNILEHIWMTKLIGEKYLLLALITTYQFLLSLPWCSCYDRKITKVAHYSKVRKCHLL